MSHYDRQFFPSASWKCDTYGKGLWETERDESEEWNRKKERELAHSAYFIMSTSPPGAAILYLPMRPDVDRKWPISREKKPKNGPVYKNAVT